MDVTVKHLDKVWVGSVESGYVQSVIFDDIPKFCGHCNSLGHSKGSCTILHPNLVTSKPAIDLGGVPVPTVLLQWRMCDVVNNNVVIVPNVVVSDNLAENVVSPKTNLVVCEKLVSNPKGVDDGLPGDSAVLGNEEVSESRKVQSAVGGPSTRGYDVLGLAPAFDSLWQPLEPFGWSLRVLVVLIMDQSSEVISVDSKDENSNNSKPEFTEDEEDLIARMYKLVGERWSLIAGRIPGRTAEEIEKYWKSKSSA
ncbi:hypothetical protein KFK09_021131 [Dendrobium nobile]|uniref:Uncharacterized protein n=1 Tax=Dendrobium nobile TaxID=94219 RepID=A0A8T3ANK3_DENNO|nr:hypothetical protein KFK09_021131 [Dendrobium nobile]